MQSFNLENCYEGMAYHYSIAAKQFSVIDWPEGENNDKIGRGKIVLQNHNLYVEAVWDNEDSRLIRIEKVCCPDGSMFIGNGSVIDQNDWDFLRQKNQLEFSEQKFTNYPEFDWMVEESSGWMELTEDHVQ
jgi:hypothetical protein